MATTEKYTTVIELNSEQAKRNLDELRRKVESWKSDLAEAREKKMGRSFIAAIRKELMDAEKELKKYDSEVARTIDTMNNLNSASVERIEEAQKSLLRLSKEVPHDSPFYEQLNGMLDQVTQELENIRATKAFEQLQQEAAGAKRSAEQLKAELAFIQQTAQNAETASVKQLQLAERTAQDIKNTAQKGSDEWNQASAALESVRSRLTAIDEEERKVVRIIDRYNKELELTGKKAEQVKTETELIDRTMGKLSSASVRDIEYSIRILNEQLRDTERTGGNVEQLTGKLKQLNEELRKVQDMQKPAPEQKNIFSRLIGGLNKNWGAITQIMGAVTGLSATIRSSVQDFADMEEQMADVRKYTGQTVEQVKDLNETFKKMDTRTSREQLNQLAGAAGRLGIQSTEQIEQFVKAADMIGVALGDDLGEGAVDKIGKLAMAFGEDERMGLQKAMLSTGSAINELAQNSSAQAGYLVDFTARVAGFGKQLGLTQAQIMGFGTVMDENLLRDEMAATAFGNMLTKMQTDTEKFARIAGMSVKEFTDLLSRDANAAILALADSLKRADPQNMMKMLDDMGLDGSRAVGVLATMADKIEDVRRHQQRATEAYEQATSVVGEFSVMNDTVQARIDKCKKRFKEMTIELGEKLLPVVRYTISGAGLLAKSLDVLISWFDKYKIAIITTTATIAALVAWKQKDVIVTKLMTLANEKLWESLVKLGKFLKKNWMGATITAVVALTTALWEMKRRSDGLTDSERNLQKIRDDAKKSIVEEEQKIRLLIAAAKDEKLSMDDRRKAVEQLNSIIPGYNAQLDETTGKYKDNKKALDDYLSSLVRKYEIEGAKERLKELGKELADAEAALKKARKSADNLAGTGPASGSQADVFFNIGQKVGAGQAVSNAQKAKDAIQTEIDDLVSTFGEDLKKDVIQVDVEVEPEVTEPDEPTTPYKTSKEGQKEEEERKKRLKKAEDAAKAEADAAIAAKTHEYAMGRIAYREYIQDMARLQQQGLERRRDVYEKGSADYERLNRKVQELAYKGDEQVNRMRLEELQRDMLLQQAEIEAQAAREEITEQQKQESLRMLQESYLADKVELYKRGTKERMDAEWELEQTEQRNKMEREQYYQQQLRQVREQYLGQADKHVKDLALKNLDDLHARGLLSERQYQEALLAVKAQYASYETTSERDQRIAANALTVAQDKARQQSDNRNSSAASLPIVGDVMLYQSTMEQLKQMYQNDEMTHAQYLAAKQQATAQFCASLASQMQTAYNSVNQVLSAASNYFSAQQEYETAQVQRKYEKQIEAAGNNQRKVKKLQEQQQKEEAAVKNKYAKRAAAIQMAQAVAQTAISAINAYSSAAAIPVTGFILAPIAAAAAIAAGMLQIATIKKQQQAQQAGYYEGGFTGGRLYRREAGVVHEGEFVANHQAVQNPAILPFLNFLDQAQRNNTVGALSMQDVSRYMGTGGATQVVAPVVNVQAPDNEQLNSTLEQVNDAVGQLNRQLFDGINAIVAIDGPQGLHRQYTRYLKMNDRV